MHKICPDDRSVMERLPKKDTICAQHMAMHLITAFPMSSPDWLIPSDEMYTGYRKLLNIPIAGQFLQPQSRMPPNVTM